MKNDVRAIYSYFSHHMRNSTATIATSVTLLAYRMSPDESSLINEIVEASFLLDLFDAGMDVCFSYQLDEAPTYIDSYPLEPALLHFMEQCKSLISERSIKLDIKTDDPAVINAHIYEIRTLSNLIIYEMILQTVGALTITLKGRKLTIDSEGFCEVPEIWSIFKSVLAARGVKFEYSECHCTLEYGV